MLVIGHTGCRDIHFKLAYIAAFNALAAYVAAHRNCCGSIQALIARESQLKVHASFVHTLVLTASTSLLTVTFDRNCLARQIDGEHTALAKFTFDGQQSAIGFDAAPCKG